MKYFKLWMILLLVPSSFAMAQEEESIVQSDDAVTFKSAEEHCYSDNREVGSLDKTYHYLNTKFCQPAIWFDSFFVDERITDDARAGTMVRWYNDFSWSESDGFKFRTSLKAKLHLPRATKKLKIVIESDADDDLQDIFPSNSDELENSVGLRYDWYAREKSSFNIKVTLRPSIEARYRYSYPLSQDTLLNFTQRVYSRKSVLGERTQIDVDHTLNEQFLVRWTNYAKYEDDINSFELASGLTLYQSVSAKQAVSYNASITGYDKPDAYISNTNVSITYRHNIYRDWLFYEITPEYNWDNKIEEDKIDEATITFRLEFLFNNV
jgi:hypothetical protein